VYPTREQPAFAGEGPEQLPQRLHAVFELVALFGVHEFNNDRDRGLGLQQFE
jgi:hypothetical protein